MIQSHYVPLERPYRIIYTGGVVGLQIGTLIVVDDQMQMLSQNVGGSSRENRSAYWNYVDLNSFRGIKTYSHPVVSYISKSDKVKDNDFVPDIPYGGAYSEAVVWDQVDQHDVMTLCLEDDKLPLANLRELLLHEVSTSKDKNSAMEAMISITSFFNSIVRLGGIIMLPEGDEIPVPLLKGFWEDDAIGSSEPSFHTHDSVTLPFVARTDDIEEAFVIMQRQAFHYLRILKTINPPRNYSFVFQNMMDQELFPEMYDEVQNLVLNLNRNK